MSANRNIHMDRSAENANAIHDERTAAAPGDFDAHNASNIQESIDAAEDQAIDERDEFKNAREGLPKPFPDRADSDRGEAEIGDDIEDGIAGPRHDIRAETN
jgi:hypothetical protein